MKSLFCAKLADGRLVFFDTMETALASVRLTFCRVPGTVNARHTPMGTEFVFLHEHRDPEWVCLVIDVVGWAAIHTTPQHL